MPSLLLQGYDGVYSPVAFLIRNLKPDDINKGMVEKKVKALLKNLGYMPRDVSLSRDQNTHSLPNYGLIVPIFGSEWESGETSRVIVELDFGS